MNPAYLDEPSGSGQLDMSGNKGFYYPNSPSPGNSSTNYDSKDDD